MSRLPDRALRFARYFAIGALGIAVAAPLAGCNDLDGRRGVRKGNRDFREAQFVDAAAEYELALPKVDKPDIHYNLGLAYSKVFKPGFDGPVLLGVKGDPVCSAIPKTQIVSAGACVKEGDRHFAECGKAKTAPIEEKIAKLNEELAKPGLTDDQKREKQADIKSDQDDLARYTCAASFTCMETEFCSLPSPVIADMAAQHLQVWIKAQPSDEDIKKDLVVAKQELAVAKAKYDKYDAYLKAIQIAEQLQQETQDKLDKEPDAAKKAELQQKLAAIIEQEKKLKADAPPSFDKSALDPLEKTVDDLLTKDQTRKLMSQLWIDSSQHDKAIAYWTSILGERPNDPEIMSNIAGINLKANDWRKSIEWYLKVADVAQDPAAKVEAFNFIGNVAWSKLNSKTLSPADTIELADRGISALQHATELSPKVPKLFGLEASIYNFRSTAHGASWAAAIDRASAQDLLHVSRVLAEEAKKAQEGLAPAPPPPPAPPTNSPTAPAAAGGSAEKTGG